MSATRVIFSAWQWQPTIVAGCALLIAAYLAFAREPGARAWIYLTGVLTLLFSLISPLDVLGDRYLLSAHMVQHLLLIVVVPPLLLLGLPVALVEYLLARPLARRVERVIGQPAIAWSLGMGTLWVWHLPAFYDAALTNEGIHIAQHLTFLIASVIFWWPVLAPVPKHRLSLPIGCIYLFAASISSSMLGIILTFAPAGLYPPYSHPVDVLGIETVLRTQWNLDPAADQQLGGLLMWVIGGLAYLFVICGLLARWYAEPDDDQLALPAITVEAR
jgi:putative membrane protein